MFPCNQQWQIVKQQTFFWPSIIHCLIFFENWETYVEISVTKATWYASTTDQHSYNLNSIAQLYKQTCTTAECEIPHHVEPSLLGNLSETSRQHTHWEPQHSFISGSHQRLSFQLTLWVAVIVCWLGICSGVITFRQLRLFQSPTLIQGLWKEPASWVNSMEGHRAERPAWVLNYSINFQIYGCATSSTLMGLGVPTNMLLQHIILIALIQNSNRKTIHNWHLLKY